MAVQRKRWKDGRGGDGEAPKEGQETTGGAASRPFGRGCALAARRRRQAFARPLVGPPRTLLFSRLVDLSLLNLAQSSKFVEGLGGGKLVSQSALVLVSQSVSLPAVQI